MVKSRQIKRPAEIIACKRDGGIIIDNQCLTEAEFVQKIQSLGFRIHINELDFRKQDPALLAGKHGAIFSASRDNKVLELWLEGDLEVKKGRKVRVNPTITADDLNDPKFWEKVQKTNFFDVKTKAKDFGGVGKVTDDLGFALSDIIGQAESYSKRKGRRRKPRGRRK